jgi:fructuronate reductase
MEAQHYIKASFDRLANPAIRHTNHQIATDGSQKLIQRILAPLAERLSAGAPAERLIAASAAWIAYLAAAAPVFGARWTASDPLAEKVVSLAQASGGNAPDLARTVIQNSGIFGPVLQADACFVGRISHHLQHWLGNEPSAHLARLARHDAPT